MPSSKGFKVFTWLSYLFITITIVLTIIALSLDNLVDGHYYALTDPSHTTPPLQSTNHNITIGLLGSCCDATCDGPFFWAWPLEYWTSGGGPYWSNLTNSWGNNQGILLAVFGTQCLFLLMTLVRSYCLKKRRDTTAVVLLYAIYLAFVIIIFLGTISLYFVITLLDNVNSVLPYASDTQVDYGSSSILYFISYSFSVLGTFWYLIAACCREKKKSCQPDNYRKRRLLNNRILIKQKPVRVPSNINQSNGSRQDQRAEQSIPSVPIDPNTPLLLQGQPFAISVNGRTMMAQILPQSDQQPYLAQHVHQPVWDQPPPEYHRIYEGRDHSNLDIDRNSQLHQHGRDLPVTYRPI